jgi:ubiquitin carboxyl-terminal hydrolase 34
MPQVAPQRMSMIGLSLFTQLSSLTRSLSHAPAPADSAPSSPPRPTDPLDGGMDQLWGIALRALNTDVSLTAIHYLNSYYIDCELDD